MGDIAKRFVELEDHSLYADLVLAESSHPILFTCVDETDGMYLVSCFRSDAHWQNWLIAKTSPGMVIDLLRNRMAIRDAFPSGDSPVWLASVGRTGVPAVRRCLAAEVPDAFFPTPGMFMDSDEEEFRNVITILTAGTG